MSGGGAERAGAELDEALAELAKLAPKKRKPTRFHARAVLIPLGRILLAEDRPAAKEAMKRLAAAVEPFREAWESAVQDELSLSCTEHVQGVDPRYLDHPRFDLEYVVSARERLEARLAAATELDLSPPEALLDRVAAADRLLEPYLGD
jgi:hypothetical protein